MTTLIATGFTMPLSSFTRTQDYSVAGELSNLPTYKHLGEDLAAPAGSVVRSIGNGVVVQAVKNSDIGFGNFVIVKHTLPNLREVFSLYAHLSSVNVSVGETVYNNTAVGIIGASGFAKGIHLHWEVSYVNKFEQSGIYGGGYDSPTEWLTSSQQTVDPSTFVSQNPLTTTLSGSSQADRLYGTSASESLNGNAGNDLLEGNGGADRLDGGSGNDTMSGGGGNDWLKGGSGRDIKSGGAGSDVFVFTSTSDSRPGSTTRDVIIDFTSGSDKIDLSAIDANTKLSGNQEFRYLNSGSFTGKAGELRMANGLIQGDVNGDRVPDFEVQVNGFGTIIASNFIL